MKKITLIFIGMMLAVGAVFAQVQVSGVVTDAADGQPLPGVSVVVKGANVSSATDANGRYTINVAGDATIVFTFIGMKTQEEAVGGRTVINVALETETVALSEVVVTAMGISREKKALGYASTSIKGEDIASTKAANPIVSLQGKVAGVDVSSAQAPGSTQNVIIRGFSSFGNNQPLYIVDGVPIINTQSQSGTALNYQVDFGSGINALNPDDIEDMTILKGAAATALYGSRAANGVVMITTKSGKNTGGKIQVSYDGSVTLTQVGRLPTEQKLFGQGWSGDRALDENGNWGAPFDGKDRVWGNVVDNSQKIKPYNYLENRIRDFFDIGVGYKNALSLSGGNEQTQYHLALSQNKIDGVMPTEQDSYQRYTISGNGSHKGKHLTVSSAINFSSENTRAVPTGQGTTLYRSLNEIATDISIVDLKDYKGDKFNTLDNYFTPYGLNPYWVLNENGAAQRSHKFFGKFQLDYDILKNLKLTYRFGGDYEASASTEEVNIQSEFDNLPPAPTALGQTASGFEWYARIKVLEGKILPKAGTSIGGNTVDSIYLKIVFLSDDVTFVSVAKPGTPKYEWQRDPAQSVYDPSSDETYVFKGYRYSGYPEDAVH